MPTLDERIDTLEAKLRVLKVRQTRREARRRARDKEQLRRDDTRRKILVGALLLARVEQGRFPEHELVAWLDDALTRDEDRKLFGLSPREATQSA
jgi:hypothetical protein